jgi:methylenetetrahydrofolate reductase (NADPH)
MTAQTLTTGGQAALAGFLRSYSAEVTARDRKGIDAAAELMAPGSEVFVAAIPGETVDRIVGACAQIRRSGLEPVPHVVARNIASRTALDDLLRRLSGEAGINRALVLGGDRDKPEGEFDCSLQLIQTGLLQTHGVKRIGLAWYPEGHPRVADSVLDSARASKLEAAAKGGLDVWLVSQFCFDPKPIIATAQRIRAEGVSAPLRVGVAGPADRATLVKYALMCGVGASLRALKERQDLAKSVITGETPEALLAEVVDAQARQPSLGLSGVHFFTFGALAKSAQWADSFGR